MTKISLWAALLITVSLPSVASPYFGVRGGIAETRLEHKAADMRESELDGMVSPYIGYRMGFLRLEAEYTYRAEGTYTKPAFDHTSQSVMGNMYLEPAYRSPVHPYISAGAGVTFHKFSPVVGSSDEDNTFTWSVGAGLGLELSRNLFMDFGYRFVDMGKPKFEEVEYDAWSNEGYIGLRFQF